MFAKVLVTLDGSPLAEKALPWVTELVCSAKLAEVVLLRLTEERTPEELSRTEDYLQKQADELSEAWRARECASPSLTCVAAPPETHDVGSGILQFAEGNGIDLIVLATHGRSGINRWLVGSVAEKVLRGSDIPVFLVRASTEPDSGPPGIKHILVPLDGSKLAEQALPYAESLAISGSAEITLLYVEYIREVDRLTGRPLSDLEAHREEEMELYLHHISSGLSKHGVKAKVKVRGGHPAEQITEEAKDGAIDLIIMSSHGRTGLARWTFSSTADKVLRTSPTPVLLVPSKVDGPVPLYLQGPLVRRCHYCGRRTYQSTFSSQDKCPRCHLFLKACGNCVHFEGTGCILRLPYSSEVYPGNRCPQFEFRKTRLVLR